MEKIKVIHIIRDDKFIDHAISSFEEDGRFDSTFYLIVNSPSFVTKYIKNIEKVRLIHTKGMVRDVLASEYDAVFFYSIPCNDYYLFDYIPDKRIVIWWMWGYDVYEEGRFINIKLYKPLTQQYIDTNNSLLTIIRNKLKSIHFIQDIWYGKQSKIISRVDFFQPVIHSEYLLMQMNKGFRAKEFYYPKEHTYSFMTEDLPTHNNNVVVGNSATLTNNHLDVWDRIKAFIPGTSVVTFPINYGNKKYAEFLESQINEGPAKVVFLKSFLPLKQYAELVTSCGYAVYGVLREQAMGAMFRCIAMGVKVFLFKDSIPYQFFKGLGCEVFPIEEIDQMSFITPLSREQAMINRACLLKDKEHAEMVRENAIREMYQMIENKV